jgi:septal ring factor EnvC (AmiA/AmiB activator)
VAGAAPYREFIREMTLRIERAMREFGRGMDEFGREMRAMRADINDLREESRAQTQALLRLLDRLDGNGGHSPA